MKNSLKLLCIPAIILAVFGLGSCDGTTNPVTKLSPPSAPTNLLALSANSSTVRVRWRASASENSTSLENYKLTVTNPSNPATPLATITIPKKTSPTAADTVYYADITGLTAGTSYTFTIQGMNKDTVGTASAISWSPAQRLTTVVGGNPIRVYERQSSFGSGLRFQGGTVEVLRIAEAAQAVRADLALNTPSDSLQFGTPSTLYTISAGRATLVDKTGFYTGVDSLNQIFESAAVTSNFTQGYYGAKAAQQKHVIFYCKTADGNFAKVLIKSVNGSLLQGVSPNRYAEFEISYQPTANLGFTLVATKHPSELQNAHFERAKLNTVPLNLPVK